MPKLTLPAITDAEWHVMKVLWDRPADWLPAADIIEPVSNDRNIHHRTARTLLARLVKKGAVETRESPSVGAYLYRAKVPRDAVVREESRSFLSRVFDGNAAPAVVHFLSEAKDRLSPDELKELRALLNGKEKK
ncbi:MAG TPA: BlaI/MecI/CopY family transcriptional regulator [Phycisphaerae bacterium]|nr:BlaI/MecI/CopY family transcriptional regulator [Phycisphaerae bacterium]